MGIPCLSPFTDLEIGVSGEVLCCCWGKYGSLGCLKNISISQIWNSERFQELRQQIYDGKIDSICDKKVCHVLLSGKVFDEPSLKAGNFSPGLIEEIKEKKTRLSSGPFKITLSDCGLCNLECKMCYRYYVNEDRDFSSALIKKKLPEFLNEDPQRQLVLKLTGNGDPFFRKETREFLQRFDPSKYPNVKFEILTNGLLLTPEIWKTINHNRIKEINVSVDAATESTYEKIRRGGNWEKLIKNLKFIGNLRRANKIKYFYINMVVMKSNYREMKDFVKLAKKLGCDEANLQRITGLHNLGENINDFPNPKIIQKIAGTLKDPIFKRTEKFFVNTLELQDYLGYKPRLLEDLRTKIKIYFYNVYLCLKKF